MTIRQARLTLSIFALAVAPLGAGLHPDLVLVLPEAYIEQQLPQSHPSCYYMYANRLFREGKREDAVFWCYVGQLRFRFHLLANPNIDPSGDPALYASLDDSVGGTINKYAGGNIKELLKTIDRALEWDEATPNEFTSKQKFAAVYEQNRTGLRKLRDYFESQAEAIREKRKKAGLENRS